MKPTYLASSAALLLTLSLLGGCGASPKASSGFLGDYSQLQPSTRVEGAKSYVKPGLNLAGYNKFIIDPIGVSFAPDSKAGAVQADTIKDLTDHFRNNLVQSLSTRYQVVDTPGPGVMRLRIAITDIKKAQPAMNLHPATKLSGLGLGAASVEAEGVDAAGERLFAFMHTQTGSRISLVEGLQDWAHAKQATDFWVKTLVERLDEAHGFSKK